MSGAVEHNAVEQPRPDNPRTWMFVRTAGPDDASFVSEVNASLWDTGETNGVPVLTWLTPTVVKQYGLTDKLRAGVQQEIEQGTRQQHPIEDAASEAPEATEKAGDWWQGAELQGGHTADWRWDFVGDLVVLDNKPALERDRLTSFAEGRPPAVEFRAICVPLEIVQAVAAMAPDKEPS